MNWNRVLKRHGWQVEESGASIDPFQLLAHHAEQKQKSAKVNVGLKIAAEYGSVHCTVSVTLNCPQDELSINTTGEVAFRKALELVNDGAGILGLSTLPEPE